MSFQVVSDQLPKGQKLDQGFASTSFQVVSNPVNSLELPQTGFVSMSFQVVLDPYFFHFPKVQFCKYVISSSIRPLKSP